MITSEGAGEVEWGLISYRARYFIDGSVACAEQGFRGFHSGLDEEGFRGLAAFFLEEVGQIVWRDADASSDVNDRDGELEVITDICFRRGNVAFFKIFNFCLLFGF